MSVPSLSRRASRTRRRARIANGVHASPPHDSAHKHVTGEALFLDDIPEPAGLVHIALGLSTHAHARILSLDLETVRAIPGVVRVLTAADIPARNDVGSMGLGDEPLLAEMQTVLKQNDYKLVPLVETIVRSPQFREIRGRDRAPDE